MVYAIDKMSTFEQMRDVHNVVKQHANPMFFLVGNKVDLDTKGMRFVEIDDGEDLKEELGLIGFKETCANDQQHINALFEGVKEMLVRDIKQKKS